jgi:hypothetical protein
MKSHPNDLLNQVNARRIASSSLLIGLVLFVAALLRFLSAVDETPFHRDEARWIHRVYYLRELTDPLGAKWDETSYPVTHDSLDERYRLRNQPPAASYALGLGLLIQGRDLNTNGYWIMDYDTVWNVEQGNMPEAADLTAARRTNAFIGALTVLAVFLLGRQLLNIAAGVAGALFLTIHPLMVTLTTQALSDPLLICLVAYAAVAAYRLANRPTWLRALAVGGLLGLAGATKLSPLLLAIPLGLLGVVLLTSAMHMPNRVQSRHWMRLGWRLLPLPFITAVTFVASYPYLWPDPIGQTRLMFEFRADSMELQSSIWTNTAVDSRAEAVERVIRQLGQRDSVTSLLIDRAGIGTGAISTLQYLDLALAVVGLAVLGLLVVRRGLASGTALAGGILTGQAMITILAMRTDFSRYHLPLVLTETVGIGLAIGACWIGLRIVAAWLTTRRAATAAHPLETTSARS